MEKEQVVKKLLQEKEISDKKIDEVLSFYSDCKDWIFSVVTKKGKCDFTEAACLMYSIIYNDVVEDLENSCDLALECGLKLIEHPKYTILEEVKDEVGELPTFNLDIYKRENFENYNKSSSELYQDIKKNNAMEDENFLHMLNFASCISILVTTYQDATNKEVTKKEGGNKYE